jgi:CubicO group peptidase (beta-lactamase class C family)
MQLVAKGVFSLEDKIAPLADAALAAMHASGTAYPHFEFTKLSDLWGTGVAEVTLRDLLAMQSGIPDFDTANPSRHGPDLDPFRATVYANPKTDFLEPELMSEPWVATHNLTSTPGSGFHYSSTNFGILGLVLGHYHATSGGKAMKGYRDFNQSSFLPPALASAAASVQWATSGSPRDHSVVPGFDRTDYNGQVRRGGGGGWGMDH